MPPKRPSPGVDIDDVVEFLCDHIITRYDDYGIQQKTGAYTRAGKPLTRQEVASHVLGMTTIGAYQITPENMVSWVLFDVDDHSGHGMSGIELAFLTRALERQDIPQYEELSGSPGSHHIWVFLDPPVNTEIAYNWARYVVRSRAGYALFRGEIFPKQSCLTADKPFGNLVKIPYGFNKRSEAWSSFVTDVFGDDGIETVDLSDWDLQDLPEYRGSQRRSGPSGTSGTRANPDVINPLIYGDVRPCIRALVEKNVPMVHYDGHKLRIAVASEYQAVTKLSEEAIARLFSGQKDYLFEKSLAKVKSVRHYNRPRCETIQGHCANLQPETGFDVFALCCNECSATKKQYAVTVPGVRA